MSRYRDEYQKSRIHDLTLAVIFILLALLVLSRHEIYGAW